MNRVRALAITAVLVFAWQPGTAQDLSRYRGYVLESTLESVVAVSGARAPDVKTLHARPAKIQELQWRAPYVSSGDAMADPVRGTVFTFYDDALYQVIVSYERDRTNGLTNSEVVESLTTLYGAPVLLTTTNRSPAALPGDIMVAQWDSPVSSLTLLRDAYSSELRLVLASKALSTRARNAIREAGRLDALDAPRRELEERKKDAADAADALAKIRTTNKAAFRP